MSSSSRLPHIGESKAPVQSPGLRPKTTRSITSPVLGRRADKASATPERQPNIDTWASDDNLMSYRLRPQVLDQAQRLYEPHARVARSSSPGPLEPFAALKPSEIIRAMECHVPPPKPTSQNKPPANINASTIKARWKHFSTVFDAWMTKQLQPDAYDQHYEGYVIPRPRRTPEEKTSKHL